MVCTWYIPKKEKIISTSIFDIPYTRGRKKIRQRPSVKKLLLYQEIQVTLTKQVKYEGKAEYNYMLRLVGTNR